MIQLIKQVTVLAIILSLAACGAKPKGSIAEKKAELDKLKKEQSTLSDKIKNLENDIAKADTSAVKENIAKLVGVTTVATQDFKHYIELTGRVDADNISYISPRLGPGQVKAVYVKRGDYVKKGQLLLKLDDVVIRQSISAARQGLEALKTQLAFAKDLYNRQNNLWKQGIGTEVQLLTAKNNVESLEKQLKAGEENIKTIQEQANASNIYSDVDGIADIVDIRVGEIFTGAGAMGPQIKIVNTNNLKVITDIPENYSAKVKNGSRVVVSIVELNKTYNTSISFSGKVINPNNRSFIAEAKLPYDGFIRPNQLAQVKIEDYSVANAIVVPVNIVGTDDKGKYVYVVVKEGTKLLAKKKAIVVGELYNQFIEVKTGIAAGDILITDGYQNIYDGQLLKVDVK